MAVHTPHLDRSYESEIRGLTRHLDETASRAQAMAKDAVAALLRHDVELARQVVKNDQELDRLEVETDDLCVRLMARRSPVGHDLRLCTMALKVVIDLERIGDLAVNIAKRTIDVQRHPGFVVPEEIVKLGEAATALLDRALLALKTEDAALARTVLSDDRVIDQLNQDVFRKMIGIAKDRPDQVESALACTSVSRHLERIGDHAKNVAELVLFLVEGKVVRHGGKPPAA
jgi:phosphate transport system protein